MSRARKHKIQSKPTSQKQPASTRRHPKSSTPKTNNRLYIGLGAVALIITAVLLYTFLVKPSANTQAIALSADISVADAYKVYEDGTALFLDVRTQAEWNDFHAPNSTFIPLDQLSARVGELPRDRLIVVVCRSGNRSQEGRDILLNAGFPRVTSMDGGMNDWRMAGYPVISGP